MVGRTLRVSRGSAGTPRPTNPPLKFANNPGINGTDSAFNKALHDELCKAGPDHCPTMLFEKGESHMSEVFSIDTPDKTVSGPILKWIKSIK